MADDATTLSGIGVLGSLVYICGWNTVLMYNIKILINVVQTRLGAMRWGKSSKSHACTWTQHKVNKKYQKLTDNRICLKALIWEEMYHLGKVEKTALYNKSSLIMTYHYI